MLHERDTKVERPSTRYDIPDCVSTKYQYTARNNIHSISSVALVVSYVLQIIHHRASPGDIVNMEDCRDEATENPMYQTYTRVLHW